MRLHRKAIVEHAFTLCLENLMDAFSTNELFMLTRHRAPQCVSIYMPTHPTGTDGQQDLVRFKNLLRQTETQLVEAAPAPLLLAGVAYLLPIYREICSYPDVAEDQLEGNCDHWTPSQIRERAFPVVEPALICNRETAERRYRNVTGTKHSSDDIAQILIAAHDGRVDTLFVDSRAQLWGSIHLDHRTVEIHPTRQTGDDDLLDLAVAQTLLHRGTLYCREYEQLTNHRSIAALLRY